MPVVRMIGTGRWEMAEAFQYHWYHKGTNFTLIVPKGFRFDFASVPRFVWMLVSPYDLTAEAPLVHDWMYHHGGEIPFWLMYRDGEQTESTWTRRDADRLFGRMMRERGVPKWKRRAAYLAVRVFGWTAWGKD